MRALPLVIFKIVLQNAVQRTLVPDDDVIQTLAANGSDQPLHKWILPGRSRCRNYGLCAHALDRCTNFSPENRISIADQTARRFIPGKSFSKLLHGPLLRRVFRYVPVQYASTIVRQHEENEQHSKGGRRYREEVHRSHLRHMIREERSPRLRRWFARSPQILTDSRWRHFDSQLEELAMDSRCPHNLLARLIRRIRSRIETATAGRPG